MFRRAAATMEERQQDEQQVQLRYCRRNCPAGLILLDAGPRRPEDLRIANRTDSKCNCDIADTIASLDRSCWMIGLLGVPTWSRCKGARAWAEVF